MYTIWHECLDFVCCFLDEACYTSTAGYVEPYFQGKLGVLSQESGNVKSSEMVWNHRWLVFPLNTGNEVVSEYTVIAAMEEEMIYCLSCLATGAEWSGMRRQLHLKIKNQRQNGYTPTLKMIVYPVSWQTIENFGPMYGWTDGTSLFTPKILAMIYHDKQWGGVWKIIYTWTTISPLCSILFVQF